MKYSIRIFAFLLFALGFFGFFGFSQTLAERHQKLRVALDNRDFSTAWTELQAIRKVDKKAFELNNYDYLQGRIAENRNDLATATASFQKVLKNNSVLREYAMWHLAQLSRTSGNLMQERMYLQQLLTVAPESLLRETANKRLVESWFESGNYELVIENIGAAKINSTSGTNEKNQTNPVSENQRSAERELQTLLGQAYLRSGKKTEAREVFNKIITTSPIPLQPDDFSLLAARGLDEIDSEKPADFGKIAPPIAESEHLKRAFIYQFNRDFADSRLHYAMLVERYNAASSIPEVLIQFGRSYILENRPAEALPYYDQVTARFPEHAAARDALNFKGAALARMRRASEAVTTYQQFIAKYIEKDLTQDNAERPYLNIVDVFRDANRDDEAFAFAAQIREKFRGKLPATLAAFAQARIQMAKTDWQGALNTLEFVRQEADLGGTRVPGGTNKNEVLFLYAYALEKLSHFDEAVNVYLEIPDGRAEFYGWRATERLKALLMQTETRPIIEARINLYRQTATQALEKDAERARKSAQIVLRLTDNPEIRREMLEIAKKAYEKLLNYKQVPNANLLKLGRQNILTEKPKSASNGNSAKEIADELLFLGLYDEGTPVFDAVTRRRGDAPKPETASPSSETIQNPNAVIQNPQSKIRNPNDERFTLAVYYKRGDLSHRSMAIIEPLWRNVPADYLLELAPREAVELMYPTPYLESLVKIAPTKEVDPRFILSIMRQESRFNAGIKSNAAARGLMQFISPTANDIARQIGKKDFRQNDLYDPPTAILFGSQYLANLYKMFPNQHAAVAASYNGGEFNMEKWLARAHSQEQDRYTSEIQFTQSKDYVYKVMANFRTYQMLYDENLRRK